MSHISKIECRTFICVSFLVSIFREVIFFLPPLSVFASHIGFYCELFCFPCWMISNRTHFWLILINWLPCRTWSYFTLSNFSSEFVQLLCLFFYWTTNTHNQNIITVSIRITFLTWFHFSTIDPYFLSKRFS